MFKLWSGLDDNPSNLGISFNSSWPKINPSATRKLLFPAGSFIEHSVHNRALNFPFDANLVNEGWNSVVVINFGSDALEVVAVELGLFARPE